MAWSGRKPSVRFRRARASKRTLLFRPIPTRSGPPPHRTDRGYDARMGTRGMEAARAGARRALDFAQGAADHLPVARMAQNRTEAGRAGARARAARRHNPWREANRTHAAGAQ